MRASGEVAFTVLDDNASLFSIRVSTAFHSHRAFVLSLFECRDDSGRENPWMMRQVQVQVDDGDGLGREWKKKRDPWEWFVIVATKHLFSSVMNPLSVRHYLGYL